MKKMNPQKRVLFLFLCLFTIFTFTATACNLPDQDNNNNHHEEPQPYDPDMDGEEPHPFNPDMDGGEALHPEPHPGGQEEPQPVPMPIEPQPEPTKTPWILFSGDNENTGPLITDLAVTDICPLNLPMGKIAFRVTNHGPQETVLELNHITCTARYRRWPESAFEPQTITVKQDILVTLKPGETESYETTMEIDANLYQYEITCVLDTYVQDENLRNNSYTETVPEK